MMRVVLTDQEVAVLEMRKRGRTFREIADILGLPFYQRVQSIYRRAMKKLRQFHYIQKYDSKLIRSAEKNGMDFDNLSDLIDILEKNGMQETYKVMNDEVLSSVEGLDDLFVKVLADAR